MRTRLPPLLLLAALSWLAAPRAARAQGMTTSCMGAVQMTLGLVVRNSDGSYTSVAQAAVANLIDQAECYCDSQDLYVEALITQALPQGTQESFEIWVGSGCNQLVNRQQGSTACERIFSPSSVLQDYWQGASGRPHERVPVRALVSPNLHSCASTSNTNSLWFIFYKQADMVDYCSATLAANTNVPDAPQTPTALSGDGAITLNWSAPPQTGNRPVNYQVLCADGNGNPIPSLQGQFPARDNAGYSTCTPTGLERRSGLFGGTTATGSDGGTAADAGTGMSAPLGGGAPLHTDGNGVDGGTPDGGVTGPLYTSSGTPPPFTYLDESFLCSKLLTSTNTSARIEGLENGKPYQFVVVGIDAYGNPAASTVVVGTPQPTEDLYRRFRDQGGAPQGFCFVATAAYGSYESPFVQVLRDFRDQELLPSLTGRTLVGMYYRASPPAASFIAQHGWARAAARAVLWQVIVVAGLWMWTTPLQKIALLALVLALVALRRRRAPRSAARAA